MRLEKVKLCNFRSFGEEQTIRFDDMTVIVGNNSAGKTAALSALNILFSQIGAERILKRNDFHIPREIKPEDVDKLELHIEAVFSFEEVLDDKETYSIPIFYNNMVVESPCGLPILRIRLSATWERSMNIDGSIETSLCYITCPEEEEITDSNRRKVPRKDLDYIRVIYVPAVRDPARQLKNVSGTMINQVLGAVKWSEDTKDNVKNAIDELNKQFLCENGVSLLNKSIHDQWLRYDSDIRYSNAVLRFNSTDIESAVKNSEVYFSPTVTEKEYTIDEMGDGLKSLFYISMVNSILDVENSIAEEYIKMGEEERSFSYFPPVLTIVTIEEPENHIAPQLLGKLVTNLKSISERNNSQVVISSHSPAIVKRIDAENLRYFRMKQPETYTIVREISLPAKTEVENLYKFVKEAVRAYSELYFAKLVILGEGDSEELILSKYLEAYGEESDVSGISIVPLGGRFVNHFWRLLSDLDIPYITLLDLDREREGGGWGRIKYAINQLLLNGAQREDLLSRGDAGALSLEELEKMHTWDVADTDCMDFWIQKLEKFDVYFSAPLDIDFLMLQAMKTQYISILDDNEGPRLEIEKQGVTKRVSILHDDITEYSSEYAKRIEADVRKTLKKEGGEGKTYTKEEKELMIWYNYFFLNRGKPATHISALSTLSNDDIREQTPAVIEKLIERTKQVLNSERK